ncbi:hypothetical protein VNO80_14284 [Phaseolus coccineus]|uniref:Uncharacterized protein n=1 Tax=Phaseolus coccineus TaxID=3886 RepID=A0AAN9R1Q7_PHACN
MGMNPDAAFDAYDWYFRGVIEIPSYIDSAFLSSRTNEVYFFLQDKYMRLDYTLGQHTQRDDKILTDLDWICYDFPSLEYTSFGAYGIECSFDTEGNKAYIFCHPEEKKAYLFKGNKYGCIDYDSKQLIGLIRNITDGFPVLKDTVFEDGIDACFASHKENQTYLFKGENYVMINFTPSNTDDTLVDGVKLIVDGWSFFKNILPLDNKGVDSYPQKPGTNRYKYRNCSTCPGMHDEEDEDDEKDEDVMKEDEDVMKEHEDE